MYHRLNECLSDNTNNFILPFFWQHGEDDETLLREINAIEASGIKALCVESRPHNGFCEDSWWHTMDFILSVCSQKNMKVWLLDDKHFPSGYANGIIPKKYPDKKMWSITERHMDVSGPLQEAAFSTNWQLDEEDRLLAIVAWRCDCNTNKLIGEPIDLTPNQYDGMVSFDVPDGIFRIFYLLQTHTGFDEQTLKRIDPITEFGGDAFIEAVYEPHYARYHDYFGNTFAGFFSDEPCFGNNSGKNFMADLGVKYAHFPFSDEVTQILDSQFGGNSLLYFPALWFDAESSTMQKIRLAYMDCITHLYEKNFCWKLGNWCRAHGVEYIGHTIEDDHQHIKTQNSAGHYFRGLNGQDMAGIDVVLCQIVPGMTDFSNTGPLYYDTSDADFFHFMLPKLGASHAHIQPLKKGRAMCEIFGAYGWAEGLKMMKWLTDFMLVRGINRFVPHAFSPKFPDEDCPPHMYAGGTNPQFRDFKLLMDYTNRVCHLLNDRIPVASAAILYYAEAAWSGGTYMRTDTPLRLLTEHNLNCDIVPADYLFEATVTDGKLCVGNASYPCLILPEAEYQPLTVINRICALAESGLPVYVINKLPKAAENPQLSYPTDKLQVVELNDLPFVLRAAGYADIDTGKPQRFLRFTHITENGNHCYYFTNEDNLNTIDFDCRFIHFDCNQVTVYKPMENLAYSAAMTRDTLHLEISPYESLFILIGAVPFEYPRLPNNSVIKEYMPDINWDIDIATQEEYPVFRSYKQNTKLFNITGAAGMPRFSGHIRYQTQINLPVAADSNRILLDLGNVGETVNLTVNGLNLGTKIAPPYVYDITDACSENVAAVAAVVTNHYGYQMRDGFSKYLVFEPSGLLGPIKIVVTVK